MRAIADTHIVAFVRSLSLKSAQTLDIIELYSCGRETVRHRGRSVQRKELQIVMDRWRAQHVALRTKARKKGISTLRTKREPKMFNFVTEEGRNIFWRRLPRSRIRAR